MQTVYIVYGLGFGDDEDRWEMCGMHSTQALADAQQAEILAEDPELDVKIEEVNYA
jgi:hypothetical protein